MSTYDDIDDIDDTGEIRLGCRHIFTNGHRCGSPALRHEHFCFYHHTTRRPGPRQPQISQSATPLRAAKTSTFDLPSPADLSERAGLGLAIGQIMHKIAHNEIDPRRAGLLLYAIQIASCNLPKALAANPKPPSAAPSSRRSTPTPTTVPSPPKPNGKAPSRPPLARSPAAPLSPAGSRRCAPSNNTPSTPPPKPLKLPPTRPASRPPSPPKPPSARPHPPPSTCKP